MQIIEEALNGVLVLQPKVFEDHRGYFYESFHSGNLKKIGIVEQFVQDNESLSKNVGVLRGLHFQAPPYAQGKLVKVSRGAVLDVALDIRKSSPTYGQVFTKVLSEANKLNMWIPKGFAHGFVTLEPETVFTYKCTNYYNQPAEGGVFWNDPALGIDWGIDDVIISEKDKYHPLLKDFISPFE
jgi:dTDP-4-dehydrorhamnose 3,5-epimerase